MSLERWWKTNTQKFNITLTRNKHKIYSRQITIIKMMTTKKMFWIFGDNNRKWNLNFASPFKNLFTMNQIFYCLQRLFDCSARSWGGDWSRCGFIWWTSPRFWLRRSLVLSSLDLLNKTIMKISLAKYRSSLLWMKKHTRAMGMFKVEASIVVYWTKSTITKLSLGSNSCYRKNSVNLIILT